MDAEFLRLAFAYYLVAASSICLRTWAQCWVADKRGDPGPRADGRLSLNPMVHFDEVGTGLLPVISIALGGMISGSAILPMLGWGRMPALAYSDPKTRGRHEMLVASGGLMMNLVLALLFGIVGGLLGGRFPVVGDLCEIGIYANAGLFVFHLIPVAPLDGFVFLRHLTKLSDEALTTWNRWGFLVFILVFNFTPIGKLAMILVVLIASPFLTVMHVLGG